MRKNVTKMVRVNSVFAVSVMAIMLLAFMLFTGCQKRVVTQQETLPPPVAKQPEPIPQPKAPEKVTEQKVESVTASDKTSLYAEEKKGMFADILFDYDKYDVKEVYKPEMRKISEWIAKNSSATVSIEGHCDERGTNEYNLALGDRRAKSVKDYIISLGVPSSRIETISYGEEKPVCTEQNEECWAKNRRAHFVILMKAGK